MVLPHQCSQRAFVFDKRVNEGDCRPDVVIAFFPAACTKGREVGCCATYRRPVLSTVRGGLRYRSDFRW